VEKMLRNASSCEVEKRIQGELRVEMERNTTEMEKLWIFTEGTKKLSR
jgi:hypothetical protein